MKTPSPKPLIEELEEWVSWKAQTYVTLAGGRSWLWFLEWTTMKSWHMRYGPLFDSCTGRVNDAR